MHPSTHTHTHVCILHFTNLSRMVHCCFAVVFVGNLSYSTTEQDLLDHLSAHRTPGVESVQVYSVKCSSNIEWLVIHHHSNRGWIIIIISLDSDPPKWSIPRVRSWLSSCLFLPLTKQMMCLPTLTPLLLHVLLS